MSIVYVAIVVAVSTFIYTVSYMICYLTKRYMETPGYSYKPVPNTLVEPFLEEKYFRYDSSDNV